MGNKKAKLCYDSGDCNSIYKYAKKLINRTLRETTESPDNHNGAHARTVKGKFGQYLEKYYFGFENNSDKNPDFKEVGIELKSTPLKKISRGIVAKERLVLNIINYEKIIEENWDTSSFLSKNKLLLLVFYLYEKEKSFLDFLIKYVDFWNINESDVEIIKQDWDIIVNKIRDGKAHELSEGDTFYLSACRKGSGKGKDYRNQPKNPIKALQRAFSFKQKYMNAIISKLSEADSIIKDESELKEKSFDKIVYDRFRPFIGLTNLEIENKLKIHLNSLAKAYPKTLALRMAGVEKKHIEEFEKAEVEFKTIRLRHNGTPKESISFPAFDFLRISKEEWIDSEFFEQTQKKFFFVVYQMDKDEKILIFKNMFFWNMPSGDIKEAEKVWEETKEIINGKLKTWEVKQKHMMITKNNFPNTTDSPVAHVRPHGQNKLDTMKLPNGENFTKQCFWLNSQYIKEQIEKN
ncbi:DNA mismatch repair protein [Methanococcoides sp. SA1]|nr:DNA mismatch repair protein [Methanococcoides sp. SA1]